MVIRTPKKDDLKVNGDLAVIGDMSGNWFLENILEVKQGLDNSYLDLRGGASNYCAQLKVYGKDASAGKEGRIVFQTINASADGVVTAGWTEGLNDTPYIVCYYGLRTNNIVERSADSGTTIEGIIFNKT